MQMPCSCHKLCYFTVGLLCKLINVSTCDDTFIKEFYDDDDDDDDDDVCC